MIAKEKVWSGLEETICKYKDKFANIMSDNLGLRKRDYGLAIVIDYYLILYKRGPGLTNMKTIFVLHQLKLRQQFLPSVKSPIEPLKFVWDLINANKLCFPTKFNIPD